MQKMNPGLAGFLARRVTPWLARQLTPDFLAPLRERLPMALHLAGVGLAVVAPGLALIYVTNRSWGTGEGFRLAAVELLATLVVIVAGVGLLELVSARCHFLWVKPVRGSLEALELRARLILGAEGLGFRVASSGAGEVVAYRDPVAGCPPPAGLPLALHLVHRRGEVRLRLRIRGRVVFDEGEREHCSTLGRALTSGEDSGQGERP